MQFRPYLFKPHLKKEVFEMNSVIQNGLKITI